MMITGEFWRESFPYPWERYVLLTLETGNEIIGQSMTEAPRGVLKVARSSAKTGSTERARDADTQPKHGKAQLDAG